MKNKLIVVLVVCSFLFLINLGFVSAELKIQGANPLYINRTVMTLVNFTLNNTGGFNITKVSIILPVGVVFYSHSNQSTSVAEVNFTNSTSGGITTLTWLNTTAAALINNRSNITNFLFNVSFTVAGDKIFTVVTNDTQAIGNLSIKTLTINFDFSGYVKNETGSLINGTNVSIYQYLMNQNSPPTELLVKQIQVTNASAGFIIESINGSASNYLLKFVHYNDTYVATKTGTILPAFPAMMYYPGAMDMSLNGSAFYLEPAATLRLNASDSYSTGINFGYEIVDKKVGFPIASNVLGNVSTADIVVPSGRDYTVMFAREFSKFTNYGSAICNNTFFNFTACPAPPKSNSSLVTLVAGQILQVTQDMTITNIRLFGCIRIAPGHNITNVNGTNITNIITKLQPWSGFIPEIRGDSGNINVTADINYNVTFLRQVVCNSTTFDTDNVLAYYNISLLGSTPYMLEFYAKNASNESVAAGAFLAALQNITSNQTGVQYMNLTLYKMQGAYWSGSIGNLNTSQMKINIQNASGAAVTTSMHVEAKVKNSDAGIGTVHYMIETLTNGTFYLPLLNNTNWAKVSVFPNDAPPIEKVLNLTAVENNITLVSIEFESGGDKGMRQMNSSGQLTTVDTSAMPIQIRFLRRGTNQEITSMNASNFNPLKALVAGNVDLEMKITATNVAIKFNNFDMFSAKQPPMFAVMDNLSAASTSQTWKFGNFVPRGVYDNITIIIPYSNSLNESWNYNISIPLLYKEDESTPHQFATAWNITAGQTAAHLTDDFIEYNATRYRNYLTSSGQTCYKNNVTAACNMNLVANQFEIEIPHFSGLNPNLNGVSPPTGAAAVEETSGGGGLAYWKTTVLVTDEQFAQGFTKEIAIKERLKVMVDSKNHYIGIVGLTNTIATINVSSTPQQATFLVGDLRKFDVTNDSYYDLSVKLESILNSKASLTIKSIHEKVTPETIAEEQEKEQEATGQEPSVVQPSEEKSWLASYWWIILIIIAIALVIVVGIIMLRKNKNKFF